jgi:4,5-dihydroxyphthalate decarboxylase
MADLPISLAINDYEHIRDLVSGEVRAEGLHITALRLPVEEIFFRFIRFHEWQVSEMGFGPYVSLISQGNRDMVGIPVFPSRVFRHSSIYVRADAGIASPRDLAGKRVGVGEWAMTAVIYVRGFLAEQYGVDLFSIDWFQAGVNEAGRLDKTKLKLPAQLRYRPAPDKSLSDMLLAGEIDAIINARPPRPFVAGDPRVRRLFIDVHAEEKAYYEATGIFPIMHLMVIRRDVYEANRWISMHLLQAFQTAKDRSMARLRDMTTSYLPLPWFGRPVAEAIDAMGSDFFPYGIEPNRKTLEAFLRYCLESGVAHRKLAVEELFAPEVQAFSKT